MVREEKRRAVLSCDRWVGGGGGEGGEGGEVGEVGWLEERHTSEGRVENSVAARWCGMLLYVCTSVLCACIVSTVVYEC